jgi:hypothetical protein
MIRAHQPGSQPIDIPEVIPNPAVVPKEEPAPKEPVKVPEKVPADYAPATFERDRAPIAVLELPRDLPRCGGRSRLLPCGQAELLGLALSDSAASRVVPCYSGDRHTRIAARRSARA